jgi:uncharacterized peroxidase-related enzyme
MAFVRPTPEQEQREAMTGTFDEDRAGWGFLPNFARTFALRPDVYRAWQQLNATIRSTMDPRRFELATLGAAAALRCSYCTLAHGRVLAERFLPTEDVIRLVADPATAPLSPTEHAVVALAEKVARHAERISEDDVDDLRALGLTDEEIFDVVLAAAARCFFAKALDGTGTAPDAAFRQQLPPDLLDVLTVGRPVASNENAG